MKKRFLLSAAMLVMCSAAVFAQKKMSILGDSYSTYEGYITPAYNASWYFAEGKNYKPANDVATVDATWWKDFADSHGYVIDINNSYSGATVCHTGYDGRDFSDRSFVSRINNVGNPDILIIFGGTNDSWAHSPIGEYQFKNWTKKDLYAFRPAFAYMLAQLRALYPGVQIYNVTNSGLSKEITRSADRICKHYGIPNILLHDIDKQEGHPSTKGMKAISQQIWNVVKKYNP